MNILITGGTGFIGRHLVNQLVQGSHRILLISRDKKAAGLWPNLNNIEVVPGDITQPESLRVLFAETEVVYHLAGKLGQAGVPDEVYQNLHYQGTKNILEAALTAKKLMRFIHCSSAGVQGPILNPPADESLPYAPSNIYEQTKADAERLVLEYHQRHALPAIILRPEFVYGPGDTHVLGLFQAIKKGIFVIFGRGQSLLHPTYIDDVAQALVQCLKTDMKSGEVFIIAGEKPVSVQELGYVIADALNVRRPYRIPLWLGYAGALIFETFGKRLKFDPPLNRSRLKFFTENRAFVTDKAQKLLGYEPHFSFEQGVKLTIDWYREQGYL
jgi:nucleoside-diphosphate-sugar epimerase